MSDKTYTDEQQSPYERLRSVTPVDNEFFLLENHQWNRFKWDAYLPGSGMLVHRVDLTNQNIWSSNSVNNDPTRNYYEVVRAGGKQYSGKGTSDHRAADLFPGYFNKTELNNSTEPANLLTWAGESTPWGLSNIAMASDGTISFDVVNALVLSKLELPEAVIVGVGMSRTLSLTTVPKGDYDLTWSSDHPEVAAVDQTGQVTGVSVGTSTITVSGPNNCQAQCVVTVEEMNGCTIAEFKQKEAGQEVLLLLNDAEVLYSYQTNAYVRDATGCITLNNFGSKGVTLSPNQRISGTVYAQLATSNNMPVARPTDLTDASSLSITDGAPVQPREVRFEDLTEADYADYVLVKGVQLVSSGGCYAVSGDQRVRVYQKFGSSLASLPAGYNGNYYDVEGIYGTDRVSTNVINEFYLMKTPVESSTSGIVTMEQGRSAAGSYYNLQGQRLDQAGRPAKKGIYILNGKKVVVK